ncbi:MAG: sigma-70 family RNA polymerase sigma factor [Pirellulales bacterium]
MDATSYKLLADACSGDAQSWSEIDRLYRPFVAGELRRALSRFQSSDADDIAQEVFKVVFLRLPGFHPTGPGSFRAFLREVTRRQTLAWLKRRRPEQFPADVSENEVLAKVNQWGDFSSELSRIWDEQHRRHWALRLWEEVERRCRRTDKHARYFLVYRAVHQEEKSIGEAAGIANVSLPTAYRALSEVQSIMNAVRDEWAPLMDLEDD